MGVWITGDTHGEFSRFTAKNFPIQKEMTKEDYVIICGDFGGIWEQTESKREKHTLDELDNRNFTTLFIDGNHENYDRLYDYPIKEWHGGRVHEIRPSVLHLIRGEVYEICGKKFFAFGGAPSHDIKDGILEVGDPRIKQWAKDRFKLFRINRLSWWEEEVPNQKDWMNAYTNLGKHNYKVDYILTHEAPASIVPFVSIFPPTAMSIKLNNFLAQVDFTRWFHGHYHTDVNHNYYKITSVYWLIERVI